MRRLLMTRWQQRLYWSNCNVLPRKMDSTDLSFTTQSEYTFRWHQNPAINTQAVVCSNHYEECISEVSSEQTVPFLRVGDLVWTEIDDQSHYDRAIKKIFPRIIQQETLI